MLKSKHSFRDELNFSNYNQWRGHHLKQFQLFPALIAEASAQLSSFQLQMEWAPHQGRGQLHHISVD